MVSKSKLQTQKFAAKLAKTVLLRWRKRAKATVIALQGDLGSGKTTFVQGFARALGIKRHITSPTFVIIRRYPISSDFLARQSFDAGGKLLIMNLYHLDLYRLHQMKEILDLGFQDITSDFHSIVIIEWPEKIRKLLPRDAINVNFTHGKAQRERIIRTYLRNNLQRVAYLN